MGSHLQPLSITARAARMLAKFDRPNCNQCGCCVQLRSLEWRQEGRERFGQRLVRGLRQRSQRPIKRTLESVINLRTQRREPVSAEFQARGETHSGCLLTTSDSPRRRAGKIGLSPSASSSRRKKRVPGGPGSGAIFASLGSPARDFDALGQNAARLYMSI